MAKITCKISFGDEIRRFTVPSADLSYNAVCKRADKFFSLEPKTYKLQYKDDEGELITMSTNEEMSEAVSFALTLTPPAIRLNVKTNNLPTRKETSSTKEEGNMQAAPPAANKQAAPPADNTQAASPAAEAAPDLENVVKNIAEHLPKVLGGLQGSAPADYCKIFHDVCDSLPKFAKSLPEAVKQQLPNAELDVAASIAANLQAAHESGCTGGVSFSVESPACGYGEKGVHPGVTCDKSGMCPIVGPRFNLKGYNYDLCEAEYMKLDAAEQAKFVRIEPPFPKDAKSGSRHQFHGQWPAKEMCADRFAAKKMMKEAFWKGVHPGVTCDKSGMCPIIGPRFNLTGHNYDLCEAEYDKLPAAQQAAFVRIEAPVGGMSNGPWKKCWRQRSGCGPSSHAQVGGCPRLGARFVSDVSIFDGTQMAPQTKFTKIWRLKNVGDASWPAGSKLLFVGGDMMHAEPTVPISDERTKVVMPGEEVDVAVDMTAPAEAGRYMGYWRLVGPMGRRRFGQRIWCHIQVVDPTATEPPHDPTAVEKEISTMMARTSEHDDDDDDDGMFDVARAPAPSQAAPASDAAAPSGAAASSGAAAPSDAASEESPSLLAEMAALMSSSAPSPEPSVPSSLEPSVPSSVEPSAAAEEAATVDKNALATPPNVTKQGSKASSDAFVELPEPLEVVKTQLMHMGFDAKSVDLIMEKNADSTTDTLLEACTRGLLQLSEWQASLDDLEEMGFGDRDLNKRLMVENEGSVKRTVKALVTGNF